MQKISFRKSLLSSILIVASHLPSMAGNLSEDKLDQYVAEAMNEFNIPGSAVGIIKDGEMEH